ncbi:MAG: M28 family peptidase [Actinomycetota bacterium]|nr:M28 family peptidase [Actinomycetota bacterium]
MAEVAQHLQELAGRIGPRPATTDAEAQAADYIEDVMRGRGLDVSRQDFECPRTYAWAYVIYHTLTIAAAVASYWTVAMWPAFAVAALVALTMWMDLDTRWGLSGLMPKGPSQNVIARHVPKARRGERLRRIIVVAHYDSARSSLAFSPGMVKNFAATFGLMKWCTFLVPALVLANALPFTNAAGPWLWYATLAASAYLVIPLLINVHRELFMRATDGANDNASGVAALLGILEAIVPEAEVDVFGVTQPIRTKPLPEPPNDDLDEGGLLAYSPAETPEEVLTELPDDFTWAETAPAQKGQATFEFDTIEFDAVSPAKVAERGPERAPSRDVSRDEPDDEGAPASGPDPEPQPEPDAPHERRGLWSRVRAKDREPGVSGWLGVNKDYDVRQEGRKIGNWDNFAEDEDDEVGFKGGWAGDDPIGDPDFASNEAQRIRKRVTESFDRSLAEKEVWFVATGAEEAGTWGMRAFLREHAEDLRGSFIINLDNIGTGTLYWVTSEGMARRYPSDRRLVSTARKVSRDEQILVKGRAYKGLSTDATPALARKFKAMSVMAFDVNGRLPNWHWKTDTVENVQVENIENAVSLVTGIVREL